MDYDKLFEFKIGEIVWDDLLAQKSIRIGITYENGKKYGELITHAHAVGYWLNNGYLGGGRHPWEISKWRR